MGSGASHQPPEPSRLSALERFFRLFTDMRPGEGRLGLLMFLNIFLVLCAYYFVKPLREGWLAVSEVSGLTKMELKAYSGFAQGVLLLGVAGAYSRLVDRWDRARLITGTTLFSMSNLVVFWLLQPGLFLKNLPGAGIAFYLWVGMFGLFVVAQFWAFAADVYTDERGRRLLPLIAIGATGGAWAGSKLAELLVRTQAVGTEHLLIAALLPLGISIVLTRVVLSSEEPPQGVGPPASLEPNPAGERPGALGLVLRHRYLLTVASVTLLLNWVNTNGENLLYRVVQDVLDGQVLELGLSEGTERILFVRDGTTAFYANFFAWVNLVALFLQAFVASRVLKYGGVKVILLVLPVVALGSYTAMALLPVLALIKVMKIAENATDYSINNTAGHVIWLPLPQHLIYKAKTTVDTLFARVGDGFAAVTVLVGVQLLSLSVQAFLVVNAFLAVLWIAGTFIVIREHRRITAGEATT